MRNPGMLIYPTRFYDGSYWSYSFLFIRILIYPDSYLSGFLFIWILIYPDSYLSGFLFIWVLIYPDSYLSGFLFIRILIYLNCYPWRRFAAKVMVFLRTSFLFCTRFTFRINKHDAYLSDRA